jgi:acyl carrier protein
LTNLEKYTQAFTETFGITDTDAKISEYQQFTNWDSVGHMTLIAALEELFDIMLDTDDIINFSSFEKGKVVLKKYDVEL